jgi:cytidylate kinase
MAPQNIEKIIERQAKFWEVQHRAAAEGGDEARQEMAQLSEGPWITVSKQWGSGGDDVARRIAEELGWQAFDREILTDIARNTKMMRTVLSRLDERAIGAFNDYMTQLLVPHDPGQITYLQEMTRVIWGLARQGRAVILGRGANWILKPEYGLRLRVVASLEERVARVADKEGLSIGDAEKQVRGHDAEQIAFIRQVFDRDINDPLGYDLMLNLASLDIDQAAKIAITAMRSKLGSED